MTEDLRTDSWTTQSKLYQYPGSIHIYQIPDMPDRISSRQRRTLRLETRSYALQTPLYPDTNKCLMKSQIWMAGYPVDKELLWRQSISLRLQICMAKAYPKTWNQIVCRLRHSSIRTPLHRSPHHALQLTQLSSKLPKFTNCQERTTVRITVYWYSFA